MDLANKAYSGKSAFGNQLIKYSTNNKKYHPNYFVVGSEETLFVVVRGSGSDADWQTNFDYHETAQKFGSDSIYCHTGFYKSAENIFNEIKDTIKTNTYKQVIVTGHSLGGAVTQVLGLMIMTNEATKDLVTYAIPFAPAPALQYIPKAYYKRIASIVNNDDIVTKLCIPCLYNMVKGLIPASGVPKIFLKAALKTSLKAIKNNGLPFGESLYNNAMGSIDGIVDDLAEYHNNKSYLKVKYISGVIYRFTENSKVSNSIASPSSFQTLSISITCVQDHVPANYVSLLQKVKD